MKKEKRKQIILIALSVTFMGIGWLNSYYQQNKSIEVAAEESRNEFNLGDVQLVNSEASDEENSNEEDSYSSQIVPNEEIEDIKNEESYFIETKLQRDTMYSEMIETYQKMLESTEVGESQKAIATQEINNITNTKNGIMISENLIKNKGFEEVVILVNNGVVSVVVKSSLLNQEQIAKIQNIVSRELNVEVQNIHISNK